MAKLKKDRFIRISDLITLPIDDFYCPFEQEYAKDYLLKYQDKVIAFKITEKYLFILLKGDRKCFIFKLELENKMARKLKDKELYTELDRNKGWIKFSPQLYNKYYKYLMRYFIIEGLK